MVNALLALLACQLAGEALVRLTGVPVPGPVLGLVLLLGALSLLKPVLGGLPESLDKVSGALLSNLSLLFVPAGVGVMVHAQRIKADWLPIAVSLMISTIVTIAVGAAVFKLVDRALGKRGKGKDGAA